MGNFDICMVMSGGICGCPKQECKEKARKAVEELNILSKRFEEFLEKKQNKKQEKEGKQESQQSLKEQLLNMVNNIDEKKLETNSVFGSCENTNFDDIAYVLESCQKTKEPTLEEQLIADGWRKLDNCVFKKDIQIKFNEYIHIYKVGHVYNIGASELRIPLTADYETIKKAVELVKSMWGLV